MKRNSFTELLFNFDKMSTSMKLQRMQDFENMVARFQGRKPRTITNKVPKSVLQYLRQGERQPVAFYNRSDPTKIYIVTLDCGIDAAKDIIHEGFHAYVHDFIKGKVTLKTFSKVDKEKFLFEEQNLPKIIEKFEENGWMELYDSFYIEERLNYQENALYLLKYIIDSIETQRDASIMLEHVIAAILYYNENESRGLKRQKRFGVNYEDVMLSAVAESNEKTEDISKAGKIIDEIDPEILTFFNQIYSAFCDYKAAKNNKTISSIEEKVNLEENAANKFNERYKNYLNELLKNKKFGG